MSKVILILTLIGSCFTAEDECKTGFENVCGTYDKHAFPVSKTMMCNRFRITQTGINGNNGNYFVLSGFELFGEIYYSKASKCSAFNKRKNSNNYLMVSNV